MRSHVFGVTGQKIMVAPVIQKALPLAGFLMAGWLIGQFAWPGKISYTDTLEHGLAQLNATLLLILLLPIGWAYAKKRWQATLLYVSYVLAGSRDLPFVYGAFFPGTFVGFGVLGWLAQAAFLALPWLILWQRNMTALSAAWRMTVIVLLLSFPPIGFIGWLNPLVLAGYLFPGTAWFGIAQFLLLCATLAAAQRKITKIPIILIILLVMNSGWTVKHYERPAVPPDWIALSTQMGAPPLAMDVERRFAYQKHLIEQVQTTLQEQRPAVLILPESVASSWLPSTKFWWQPVADQTNTLHTTLLVGADRYIDNNQRFYNSLINIGNSEMIITARLPMPIGQWRPWTTPSAVMQPFGKSTFSLGGQQVTMSFCYEDFLFWMHAMPMWQSEPTVMISIANNWFAHNADEPWIQARHMQLWANLWGIALLRAVNL